jgi:predicted DNA-binding antitoxin AbrB/MazE fold protein
LVDDNGQKVKLKPGAEVDVTIEAEPAKNTVSSTDEGS